MIFSVGPNGASGGSTGTDEIENTNNDRVFVFRPIGAGYDDVLVWLSPHVLYNRMVAAGKLP